ncbi:ABC transporter ATP-binding protein [Gordonia sp. (in: high G+C Gram-positive bacteria)]|uniref:ABC transporter ATP-binding protein n=1 Tax=Gordonia sp. (in: high G+C Gram-positive bacteria) TaxID=84139 RepID=UPI003F9EB6E3
MIYSDLAAVTGPRARGDRITFVALSAVSTAVQAGATITLVPLLRSLFGENPADAWGWVGLLIGLLVVVWAFDVFAARAGLRLGLALMYQAESVGVTGIRRLDPSDLHSAKASKLRDLVSRGGVDSVSSVVLLGSPLIRAVLMVPFLALALLAVSWQLALVALVCGVVLFGALWASRRAVAHSEEIYAESGRELDEKVLEFAWAQPTLRGSGAGTGTMDAVLDQRRRSGLRLLAWDVSGETLFAVVQQVVLLAFGVATAALYLNDEISGVTAAAMIVVLLRIVESTSSLSLMSVPMAMAERVLADLRGLATRGEASDRLSEAGAGAGVDGSVDVALEQVAFDYPDGTRALHEVDLQLPAGSTTVIVGASGSGKSTLLDVLTGLREPTSGRVLIGGRETSAAERLAATSMVFQATELRPGTLRQNVDLDRSANLDALAERAALTETLDALPHGWDTRVGEAGNALSGGERQRVGLARALAKRAPLLMVDEATSALDAITERAVVDALADERGTRTIVVVTHRPALVALADRVIVLEDGRIAEAGGIQNLLDSDGVFARLWERWRQSEGWKV